MKTIKDLSIENINKIYSIIIGEERFAGDVQWTSDKDFVIATFKVEECTTSGKYDTIKYGIEINSSLQVTYTWTYVNSKGHSTEYRPLYNHHEITKYLLSEGFDLYNENQNDSIR